MASINYLLNKVLPVNSEVLVHLKNIGSPDLGIVTPLCHKVLPRALARGKQLT
jgi:hypothetical protein